MPRTNRPRHQQLLSPTGAVATAETLRTGDTVLVWTHANPEAPKRTWGAVAPFQLRLAGARPPRRLQSRRIRHLPPQPPATATSRAAKPRHSALGVAPTAAGGWTIEQDAGTLQWTPGDQWPIACHPGD